MATETIVVDGEKLEYLMGLLSCGSCPVYKECSRNLTTDKCEEKIIRWIKPSKEYRVRATMTFDEEIFVEAENEQDALEEARERFDNDYCFTSIELSVEEA